MSLGNKLSFQGHWTIIESSYFSGSLNIKKTGETYKCIWKLDNEESNTYIGIGMLFGEKLIVSRFTKFNDAEELPRAGVGVYISIGDNRSSSALWASTTDFNVLGAGIALRKETSKGFKGNYKVRYFLGETESPVFDVSIDSREGSDIFSLSWSLEGKQVHHGAGLTLEDQLIFAWGDLSVDCELIVLSMKNEDGKLFLTSSQLAIQDNFVNKEVLVSKN